MKSDMPPRIENPCPKSWDGMVGDSKVRFCSACQLQVHNLSEMDATERRVVLAAERGLCITYNVDLKGRFVSHVRSHWLGSMFSRARFALMSLVISAVPFCFSSCVTRTGGPPLPPDKSVKEPEAAKARPNALMGRFS